MSILYKKITQKYGISKKSLTKGLVFPKFSLTKGMVFPNFSLTKGPIFNLRAAHTYHFSEGVPPTPPGLQSDQWGGLTWVNFTSLTKGAPGIAPPPGQPDTDRYTSRIRWQTCRPISNLIGAFFLGQT